MKTQMRNKRFAFPVNPLVGSSVGNIVALWKKHKIDAPYLPKFLLTLLIACIFEIFNFWEKIILRKRMKTQLMEEPPVFIIGFWRSGTTLLHNLLCRDPKAAYTTTFHVVFPHSTVTQAWWLKKLTNLLLPPDRPFDNVSMDMDFPQEEEYGMAALQPYSFYNIFNFPKDFERIFREEFYTEKYDPVKLNKWWSSYKKLIRKAMINTGGSRYISKNPCNLARIEMLLKAFPEAKFIFIYRNPYKVAESLYRFILSIFPGTRLQSVPDDLNREKIVRIYAEIMRHYFSVKSAIPDSQLIEIKMEDFVKNKLGFIQNIYQKFNLPGFENALPYIKDYLSVNSNYSRDYYETAPEIFNLMNDQAREIIERLGYKIESPAS
jgi:hypothetical protein